MDKFRWPTHWKITCQLASGRMARSHLPSKCHVPITASPQSYGMRHEWNKRHSFSTDCVRIYSLILQYLEKGRLPSVCCLIVWLHSVPGYLTPESGFAPPPGSRSHTFASTTASPEAFLNPSLSALPLASVQRDKIHRWLVAIIQKRLFPTWAVKFMIAYSHNKRLLYGCKKQTSHKQPGSQNWGYTYHQHLLWNFG